MISPQARRRPSRMAAVGRPQLLWYRCSICPGGQPSRRPTPARKYTWNMTMRIEVIEAAKVSNSRWCATGSCSRYSSSGYFLSLATNQETLRSSTSATKARRRVASAHPGPSATSRWIRSSPRLGVCRLVRRWGSPANVKTRAVASLWISGCFFARKSSAWWRRQYRSSASSLTLVWLVPCPSGLDASGAVSNLLSSESPSFTVSCLSSFTV
mmetsp:Transcript_16853/g.26548  ORF Transcript_16853/g.26548 Transcript_16853/m.26548 type:complete len:212 (+) Transcript_16853:179-814(+)